MGRQLADVLREMTGDQYDEINGALSEIVEAAMETGRAGELTIKLKIKPSATDAAEVSCDIKAKVPELPKKPTIFFVVNGDSLIRNNPRQQELPLRAVETPAVAPLAAPLVPDGPLPMKSTG